MTEIWPNFFIAGAARSGTTSLYTYLKQHPQVYLSPIKEPHYFAQITPSPAQRHVVHPINRKESYLHLFRGAGGAVAIGEASPSYLWEPQAPARIQAQIPEARILLLLRDPVERAYSHYLMDVREGQETLPFEEALQRDWVRPNKGWGVSRLYVELGFYAPGVERFLRLFGPERVKVLFFEDLVQRPEVLLKEVQEFLGLNVLPLQAGEPQNAYRAPRGPLAQKILGTPWIRQLTLLVPPGIRHPLKERFFLQQGPKPAMSREARRWLQSLYAPDLARLEELLGRKLPQLRRSWC